LIIDSPILLSLPLGVDRIVPQQGDAQVEIPSTITPVIDVMLPTDVVSNNAVVFNNSFVLQSELNLTGVGAGTTVLITLARGYYNLKINGWSSYYFAAAGPLKSWWLTLDYQGFSIILISGGGFTHNNEYFNCEVPILLRGSATLTLRNPIIAAGELVHSVLSIVGQRQL
jgi:hypothetical protein